MAFHSILFVKTEDGVSSESVEEPGFFPDLNLDQIISAITFGKEEYNLKPFFYTSLHDPDAVKYRYEIMQDLENAVLLENIKAFARRMRAMLRHLNLINQLSYRYNKEGWFLTAVDTYCEAVQCLVQDLTAADLASHGLLAFREYLTDYAQSEEFTTLFTATEQLKADLSTVSYCLLIKDSRITVRNYAAEIDYSAVVDETFAKFKQGAVTDYRIKLATDTGLNHVEAQVLDLAAKLHPEIFLRLDDYCRNYSHFVAEKISRFDREIQFYVAYLDYIATFKRAGLPFCYPQISDQCKEVHNYAGFDLALAHKLLAENARVVGNDFQLTDKERILVVTGPNQGGKTTFARMFGQLHYLAGIGCPVPGREAQLFLCDRLFTHFEKEEAIENLRGKLEDDLVRIYHILNQATASSIIILNEIFTSTTLKDAALLGRKIMQRISQLDLLCVCVTFIDELAACSEKTVSMVSTVAPENPASRTYKIIRKPADGLSYAIFIAEKYRLTYDCLKERLQL
ncbi:Hypothetical protein LUCI_5060 [Lucifera butyrica]|uniref:DNA mismatch repair proteins mutS family domain-containing protein n=1 Tax=Lucifera butyrica TaxID=1351585 RepID=A0A498RI42_9FIRM|nr:DNA mismatch repair protein MutS [Lucifera butyrica]VBB09762.1 Hypothetical protein LUCI_5060 [Lucifera butyrica]